MELIRKDVSDMFSDGKNLYYTVTDYHGGETYWKYEEGESEEITLDLYFNHYYGEHYKKIMEHFGDRHASRYRDQKGFLYVCYYQNSVIYKFDDHGDYVQKYEEMGKIDAIYDIAVVGDSIWCAYPTSHTVKRFSLEDEKLEASISDGEIGMYRGSLFCYPESITMIEDKLYVSDMGNQRICIVDLRTLNTEVYLSLDRPVFRYERIGVQEFILTNQDIYLVR